VDSGRGRTAEEEKVVRPGAIIRGCVWSNIRAYAELRNGEKGKPAVDHATVLLISDDAGFSRSVKARWQMERAVPTFTLMSSDLWPRSVDDDDFEIAIVGPVRQELLSPIIDPLHSSLKPLFCVCADATGAHLVRARWPQTCVLRSDEGWLDALILSATEALQRVRVEERAQTAEQACIALERQALLGRYMLEVRHGLNNALTSLLGNSDLLLTESIQLTAAARGQVETIRNMTLRIHEVLQRFSSLEKEMNVVAQQVERDSGRARAAAAGAD
jgi:signal transduction histidine kinase